MFLIFEGFFASKVTTKPLRASNHPEFLGLGRGEVAKSGGFSLLRGVIKVLLNMFLLFFHGFSTVFNVFSQLFWCFVRFFLLVVG